MDDEAAQANEPWHRPEVAARAADAAGDVGGSLALAAELSPFAAALGTSRDTWAYLATLATLGASDLTTARVVEPHLDALAILGQSGLGPALPELGAGRDSTWGVYAAEAPGRRLDAAPDGDRWLLSGTKPWCSLADRLSHAVVTAHVAPERRRAFAVDLRAPGIRASDQPWVSRGLTAVRSTGLELDAVPAVPVGDDEWYLTRPGFAWGGIGVAAVWFGAACALRDRLVDAASRRPPDQIAHLHLGATDRDLYAAQLTLRHAAGLIDAGHPGAGGVAGGLLAARVRAVVAEVAERVLLAVGHALGPAPLTGDEEHARRVADLTVYLRQHHAERDLVRLGETVLAAAGAGPARGG